MTAMAEEAVRDNLQKLAAQATDRPLDYDAIWDRSMATKRRRSRWAVMVAVASSATLVALVAVLPADKAAQPPTSHQPTTTRPPTSTNAEATGVEEWAAGLPLGPPPAVPYVAGSTLHVPGQQPSRVGSDYRPLGSVPGGVLIESLVGPGYRWRFGILSVTGQVSWLTSELANDPQAILSMDHHESLAVAVGHDIHVYDLKTKTETGTLATDGYVELTGFTIEGVVYTVYPATGEETSYVWSPGTVPDQLDYRPEVLGDSFDGVLVQDPKDSRCMQSLTAGSPHQTLFEACGTKRPYALSSDGVHALTVDGQVVNVLQGTVSTLNGNPDLPLMPDATWEDLDNVLIRLPITTGSGTEFALVRCSVSRLDCERALPAPVNGRLEMLAGY